MLKYHFAILFAMVRRKRPITSTPQTRYYKVNGKRRKYKVWRENGKVKRRVVHKRGKHPETKGRNNARQAHRGKNITRSPQTRTRNGKHGQTRYYQRAEKQKYSIGIEHKLNERDKINAEFNTKDGASLEIIHKTPAGKLYAKITPSGPKFGAIIDGPSTRKTGRRKRRAHNEIKIGYY